MKFETYAKKRGMDPELLTKALIAIGVFNGSGTPKKATVDSGIFDSDGNVVSVPLLNKLLSTMTGK